ncbi:MAG: Uma2 family endonuclease [Acidobacteria bacterium]|nr:Uma2 family endonuclease [Acidobacteriota bacterium]
MAARIEQLITVDELDLMPDDGNRYEVIEGELFMSRAPDFIHQAIIMTIGHLISLYLDKNPIGILATGPGIIFSRFNGVIPDLVFVTHETRRKILSGGKLKAAPELVVEIISPGAENRRRDRVAKRSLYGKYGVKEYWIVDPKTRSVEVYHLKDKLLVLAAKLKDRDKLTSSVLPGFSCKVKDIFADVD